MNTRPAILPTLAVTLLASQALLPALRAQSTWSGGGADTNWSTSGNWDVAPANGSSLTFGSAFTSGTALTNDTGLTSIGTITFNTTLPAAGLSLSGADITLTGGIVNNNITAGRNVTIGNNIIVTGAQTWSTVADVDAVTIFNGNLTGFGNITIGTTIGSNNTNLPTLRFAGNNSNYTGTISFTAADAGILLASPSAQTGGLVDLNGNNRNLWLTTNSAANPYTFWTGNATPGAGNPMAVNFRNAGTAGLYLTGGDVHWNPTTSGNNYAWDVTRAGTHGEIRLNGSNDAGVTPPTPALNNSFQAQPRMLYFGNSSGSLVLGGNRSITNGGGGSNAGRVTMNYALSDDGTARNFTTSAGLMILTREAGGGGGTPSLGGNTVVSGGALAVGNMNRIFNGWLNLSGGVMVLDNVSWSDFMTDRSAGYHGSGAANAWGINSGNSGFAARGSDVTILIDANAAAAYGTITAGTVFNRDFTIGSTVLADDKSRYASNAVNIAQNTVLSLARIFRVAGGNREDVANWTLSGPIHEFSGSITGAVGLTIGGAGTTGGGTLRLSNIANTFNSLAINPSGQGGGLVVLATDDATLGTGSVTIGSGAQGQAGMLLFENQTGSQKTFAKSLTVAMGGDGSSGDSGFGSYAGDVLYTGTATVTGSRTTLPVHVQAGKLTFGAGSSIVNNSTGTQTYSKGGAGELVLDANTTYAGSNANLIWAHRQGTLTTTVANRLVNGTGVFDGDNIIGADGVTWSPATGGNSGSIPVSRTWKVTTNDQSYTSGAMAFTGYTTVDVEANRTLTLSTGSNATGTSEARGNGTSTPRWDLVKTGGGTWVFTNTDLASPAASGPQNGAGFLRVDQGTLDITGDYGRGSLSVNGGTLLSGSFSPFTYSNSGGQLTMGVGATNLLEVTTAGGKIGISAIGSGAVTRTVGFYWDQSGTSKLTLAARDNRDLVFSTTTAFPNVAANNTLSIDRDGSGAGVVQINDTTFSVDGTLAGSGTLKMGSTGTGMVTINGILAPGNSPGTLDLNGMATLSSTALFQIELGGANPGDGSAFHDQFNATGTVDLGGSLTVSDVNGFNPAGGTFYLLSRTGGTGNFFGLTEGAAVMIGTGYTGQITYQANWTGSPGTSTLSGGDDVAIFNVTAIPEPKAAGLGVLALLLTAFRRAH